MTPDEIKLALNELQVVTLTLYGEVRNEPLEGILAVGCLIRNRVLTPKRFGKGYKEVCLKKSQFSCWWPYGGASNFAQMMRLGEIMARLGPNLPLTQELTDRERRPLFQCQYVAQGILDGHLYNRSMIGRADHYYAPAAMVPVNRVPDWAKGLTPTAVIGGHRFYTVG